MRRLRRPLTGTRPTAGRTGIWRRPLVAGWTLSAAGTLPAGRALRAAGTLPAGRTLPGGRPGRSGRLLAGQTCQRGQALRGGLSAIGTRRTDI